MKKLKKYFVLLVVLLLLPYSFYSQEYTIKETELQQLETILSKQEILIKDLKINLTTAQEQIQKQQTQLINAQELQTSLTEKLQQQEKLYKKSETEILKNKIIIGGVSLVVGFSAGALFLLFLK